MSHTLILWNQDAPPSDASAKKTALQLMEDQPPQSLRPLDNEAFLTRTAELLGITGEEAQEQLAADVSDFTGHPGSWLTLSLSYSDTRGFHAVALAASEMGLTLFSTETDSVVPALGNVPEEPKEKPDTFAHIVKTYLVPVLEKHAFKKKQNWIFKRIDGDRVREVVFSAIVGDMNIRIGVGFRPINRSIRAYRALIRENTHTEQDQSNLRLSLSEILPDPPNPRFPFLVDASRVPEIGRSAAAHLEEALVSMDNTYRSIEDMRTFWLQNTDRNWKNIALSYHAEGRTDDALAYLEAQRALIEQQSKERYDPRNRYVLIDLKWLHRFISGETNDPGSGVRA